MGHRILIAGGGTGGHLVPALNLAAALRRAQPDCELLLVGAERGVEARVLPTSGYPYRLLPMQPLHRNRPWRNWRLVTSVPGVFRGVKEAFGTLDPDVVVGTGGYASAPPLAYAIAAKRPTAIQEQNAWPGLVTRLLARHVDQIHLGYPEAEKHLRPGRDSRVQAHGNPVARPVTADGARSASDSAFRWPSGRVVLVTGGSQGAKGLNELLLRDLSVAGVWPDATTMVWVAGPSQEEAVATAVRGTPWADRIRVVPWIDDLGARLHRAELAIARAGAMSCAELAAAGVPALLVPLPRSAGDHQRHNAEALEAAGAALVFEEGNTARGALWSGVVEILASGSKRRAMAGRMAERGRPEAADRIASDLLQLAAESGGGRHADD